MGGRAPRNRTKDPGFMFQAEDILALHLLGGVGRVTVNRVLALCARAGLAAEALLGRPERQALAALPPGCAREARALSMCSPALRAEARALLERARQAGVQPVPAWAPAYPQRLAAALGLCAPPVLYLRGPARLLQTPCAGVVGGRAPSAAGRRLASKCARELVSLGGTVVSGGAQGIDQAAHRAALNAEGGTVVVLPQGLLAGPLPGWLAAAVDRGAALVVSEFAPLAGWQTHAAVTRNATISALSGLLCVVDARCSGGSVQTARHALAQGKPVLYGGGLAQDCRWARHSACQPLATASGALARERLATAWQEAQSSGASRQPELFQPDSCCARNALSQRRQESP